ncbi:hypothetical protein GY45DRAFT_1274981 [Cubamyces sp. BRFM 1775]|nr:hypothetical protein GY45DRAFT_1274981 [Cubamyces sp. BRFM 1775]
MSEQVARAHTSTSNRAKARDNADRKVVYRSVVDNPFRVQWPTVPLNVQNAVLACVVDMLAGVAEFNIARENGHRRKRSRPHSSAGGRGHKRQKGSSVPDLRTTVEDTSALNAASIHDTTLPGSSGESVPAPPIMSSLTVGINEVTKSLEQLASSYRRTISPDTKQGAESAGRSDANTPRSRIVLACRADVDPPALMAHVPSLIAACNSCPAASTTQQRTWLVPLPKGAEYTLAEALGLRRASILLVEDSASQFPVLEPLIRSIPIPVAPWLQPPMSGHDRTLVPTHIKQLRTTAPKDMKRAKDTRARARTAAKERRKTTLASVPKRVTLSSTT